MNLKGVLLPAFLIFLAFFGLFQYKKRSSSSASIVSNELVQLGAKEKRNALKVRLLEDLDGLPLADRVEELFEGNSKLSIVKTIRYTPRVDWLIGRSAWISDYASHFNTSKHFIARSVSGGPNYVSQPLHQGDCFNVYSENSSIEYHMVVDLSRCRVWLYYNDKNQPENVLLKTYLVSVGGLDNSKKSGSLTPVGTYQLGEKVSTYKPQIFEVYKGEKIEMIQLFGTRWIPFCKEIENCSEKAGNFGLHGCPWEKKEDSIVENRSGLGKYTTNGSIHFAQEDIEEIYALVVTKPTFVHIVKDFYQAKLPEKNE